MLIDDAQSVHEVIGRRGIVASQDVQLADVEQEDRRRASVVVVVAQAR